MIYLSDMSKMVFSEVYLRPALIGLGLLAGAVLAGYLIGIYREQKQLKAFRAGLKKGDYVLAEIYGEQMVWTNHLDSTLTLRIGEPETGYCYRKVSVQDVYPPAEKVTWELS